jgi:hypothetical protein
MIVRDIVELHADVQRRRERLERLLERRGPGREDDLYSEEVDEMEKGLDADLERLRGFGDELAEIGAELKDPAAGLIDFPTLVDDRDAWLCWKLGEDSIEFWHDLQSGFAGRQPIPFETE